LNDRSRWNNRIRNRFNVREVILKEIVPESSRRDNFPAKNLLIVCLALIDRLLKLRLLILPSCRQGIKSSLAFPFGPGKYAFTFSKLAQFKTLSTSSLA
jgi:hypothetical protein